MLTARQGVSAVGASRCQRRQAHTHSRPALEGRTRPHLSQQRHPPTLATTLTQAAQSTWPQSDVKTRKLTRDGRDLRYLTVILFFLS